MLRLDCRALLYCGGVAGQRRGTCPSAMVFHAIQVDPNRQIEEHVPTACFPVELGQEVIYGCRHRSSPDLSHKVDLKSAEIKVTPEDKVKVLDFGLAKASHGSEARPLLWFRRPRRESDYTV